MRRWKFLNRNKILMLRRCPEDAVSKHLARGRGRLDRIMQRSHEGGGGVGAPIFET